MIEQHRPEGATDPFLVRDHLGGTGQRLGRRAQVAGLPVGHTLQVVSTAEVVAQRCSGNVMAAFAAPLSDDDIDSLARFYAMQDGLHTPAGVK